MRISSLLLFVATATAVRGQSPGLLPNPAAVVNQGCGLEQRDGVWWGLGPAYKARFTAEGMEFTPALGARAPRNMPLRFTLSGVGRGEAPAAQAPASTPRWDGRQVVDGLTVRYHHDTCVETYEVRSEGVEQAFAFAELPSGTGDLWVRGRIDTELSASADGWAEQLDFLAGDLGGVRIGAILGVDANGKSSPGSMRYRDGHLELRLPAAFVDGAALPLILDPLVGTTISLSGSFDDEYPDVAHHSTPSESVYLVVWHRRFSTNDTDVRGQRLDASDLSLLGGVFGIRTHTTIASEFAKVAVVSARDRFVVAWRERSNGNQFIAACSVSLAGAVSPAIQAVAGTDAFGNLDLGGDHHDLGTWATMVYSNITQGRIEYVRLVIGSDGTLSNLGRGILAAGESPSISSDGGVDGRFLVVWSHRAGFSDFWVEGALIDRFTNFLATVPVSTSGGAAEVGPHVDGDGLHWVVAYERRPAGTPGDVVARWITFDARSNTAYMDAETLVAGGSDIQNAPRVCFLFGDALITYLDQRTGLVYDAFVRSIDHFSCAPCEGTFALATAPASGLLRGFAASASSGGGGVLLWEEQNSSSVGAIKAQAWGWGTGAVIGTVADCGPDVYGTCARRGNSAFALRLEHATPNVPALLMVGPSFDTLCGTGCPIVDPFRGFVVPVGTTDNRGNLAVSIPLPSAGVIPQVWFQFGFLPMGSATCPSLGIDISDIGLLWHVH